MQPRPAIWDVIRSVLHDHFPFGTIKTIAGYGGIDLTQMAHLEQTSGSVSASKSQLLSAIDRQVGQMDESRQHQFIRIIAEEMLRRRPQVESDLRDALERLGWTLYEGHMVELAILDISDLPELPADSRGDLVKAATWLRDGDLSGAISSACAAVDTVTSRIYQEEGLGDPGDASFQERVNRALRAQDTFAEVERQIRELGWELGAAQRFTQNLQRALNHGAYVMQTLRSRMGDVHGTKPILKPLVFDSLKWAALIVRFLR